MKAVHGKGKKDLNKKSYFALEQMLPRKEKENLIYYPNYTERILSLPSISIKLLML